MEMRKVWIRFDEDTLIQLEQIEREQAKIRSDVIREALALYSAFLSIDSTTIYKPETYFQLIPPKCCSQKPR